MPTICGSRPSSDGDEPDGVVGQRRGGRDHLPRHEQDLHDVGRGLPDRLRDRLRRGAAHDLQDRYGRRGGRRAWAAGGAAWEWAPARSSRACRGRLWPSSPRRAPRPRRTAADADAGSVSGAASGTTTASVVATGTAAAGAPFVFWAGLAFGLGLRGAGGGSSTSRRFGASVALPPDARSRGTRSSGTLEEADLPATPICSSVSSSSLLETPSSFASS